MWVLLVPGLRFGLGCHIGLGWGLGSVLFDVLLFVQVGKFAQSSDNYQGYSFRGPYYTDSLKHFLPPTLIIQARNYPSSHHYMFEVDRADFSRRALPPRTAYDPPLKHK